MSNPIHCGKVSIKRGFTKAGTQRYKCKVCGKTFTITCKPRKSQILDRPLTQSERKRRSRGEQNWREF